MIILQTLFNFNTILLNERPMHDIIPSGRQFQEIIHAKIILSVAGDDPKMTVDFY